MVSDSQKTGSKLVSMVRKLKPNKYEYDTKFLIFPYGRLNALNKNVSANELVDNVTRTIGENIDHFVPERLYREIFIQNQWITNKLKVFYKKETFFSRIG